MEMQTNSMGSGRTDFHGVGTYTSPAGTYISSVTVLTDSNVTAITAAAGYTITGWTTTDMVAGMSIPIRLSSITTTSGKLALVISNINSL